MDDSNVWESLGQVADKHAVTVNELNELIEAIGKCFADLETFLDALSEEIVGQVRVELSRQAVKQRPPLKLVRTYSFIPSVKKNLPYQRRNY